jgi:acyl-CoA hydrolase
MKTLTPAAAVAELAHHARGGRIVLSAGPAEPLVLHDAWSETPETAADILFAGLFVPGLNRLDYAALHPRAGMDIVMLSPDWRQGFVEGRTRLRPMHYSAAFATLIDEGAPAGAFTVSAPDSDGLCSFGLAADLPPAMLVRTGYKVAVINHAMPHAHAAPRIALSAFDAVVETDMPLPELAAAPSNPVADAIAAQVGDLVRDGDTIQTGIGKLPLAAAAALSTKHDLRVHSGLVVPAHLDLVDAGAIQDAPGAIRAGVAAGDQAFYKRIAAEPRLSLVSVAQTHGAMALAAIDNLVAINAALEVDLFGQVNAAFAGAQQISGSGGLVDFIRGARASRGGRAIVMVQAEGKGGVSRVVPRLAQGAVTVAQAEAPIIVTEFGVVDLAPLGLDARASALIALAPPSQRDALAAAWREIRASL